jgi:hypothetical protein
MYVLVCKTPANLRGFYLFKSNEQSDVSKRCFLAKLSQQTVNDNNLHLYQDALGL